MAVGNIATIFEEGSKMYVMFLKIVKSEIKPLGESPVPVRDENDGSTTRLVGRTCFMRGRTIKPVELVPGIENIPYELSRPKLLLILLAEGARLTDDRGNFVNRASPF